MDQPQTPESKPTKLRYLTIGSCIVFIIITLPLLFYIVDIFPEGQVWETNYFTYNSRYFQSVSVFVWVLVGKLIPLILLIIWYFTCKNWWYRALLVPIAVYAYQLISVMFEDSQFIDNQQVYYLVPLVFIILCSLYTIRTRIFDKINNINLSELIDLDKKRKGWKRFL